MKRNILLSVALLVITGCASTEKTMTGLNSLIGKDAELAFLILGYPTQKQEFIKDIVYEWSVNERGTITLPQTTLISGSIGTTPVYGTMQGTRTIQTHSICSIKIITDQNNKIKGREISGNYDGCSGYMNRLSMYSDLTKIGDLTQKTELRTNDIVKSDANAEKEISEILKIFGEFGNIKATVFNQNAVISGVIASKEKAHKIMKDIKNLQGIGAIGDELELTTPPHNYPNSIDDFIVNAIHFLAQQDDNLKHVYFKTNVIYGKVILMGITSRVDGQRLAEIAARIGGVRLVIKHYEYTH